MSGTGVMEETRTALLSAADIFGANDLTIVEEAVPEWPAADGTPGVMRLRQLSAADAIKMSDQITSEAGKKDGMFIILVWCAVDAAGVPLFTMADIERLRGKSMKVLDRLQRRCLVVNSMLETEVALKKD